LSARRPRVLAISSRGGHWVQLRRLARAFEGCETVWASTDSALRPIVGDDRFLTVPDASRWNPLRVAYCALVVLIVLLRVRPDVVVSTGAAPGLLALRLGRLLGMRTVWIDSLANADTLSLSGRRASRFTDLTLTQWPHLGRRLVASEPPAVGQVFYAGSVLGDELEMATRAPDDRPQSASPRPRVVAIASRGGHWTELRRLKPVFEACDVTWISTDASTWATMPAERYLWVPDSSRWSPIRIAVSSMVIGYHLLRLRPETVVSTGAAPGLIALRIAKLLGARTIWIDSIANAEVLSLSGQKASRFADLTLTQWPELGESLPVPHERRRGAIYYAGAVL